MKCKECNRKNVKKALYCMYCGHKFTKEEKDKSSSSGIVYFIKKIKKWYNTLTLKVVTENIFFKFSLLLLFIGISIYNFIVIFDDMKIKVYDSSLYDVSYNEVKDEYYVVTHKTYEGNLGTKVNLYIPPQTKKLQLSLYSEDGSLIYEEDWTKDKDLVLMANTSSNNYYIISDKEHKKRDAKVFVYYEGDK